VSIKHDSKFTFECDREHGSNSRSPLVVEAKTERAAIAKARRHGWDVVRIRALTGVAKDKVARLTLGGTRPGTGTLILPGRPVLVWSPCLKRAQGSEREHCWFLALTTRPTLFCWDCKPEVA
jgi:hypothetical protein